jgi:hypothetical protein
MADCMCRLSADAVRLARLTVAAALTSICHGP